MHEIAAQFRFTLNLYLAKVADSKPFQFCLEHKRPVTIFLYIVLLTGFGYWFYQLMIIDVKPDANSEMPW
jgi:hypothetical protein